MIRERESRQRTDRGQTEDRHDGKDKKERADRGQTYDRHDEKDKIEDRKMINR